MALVGCRKEQELPEKGVQVPTARRVLALPRKEETMKEGDWEWIWYDGEPSPMENVVIKCKGCGDVMGFHEEEFRPMTGKDLLYIREYNFCYVGYCWECWNDLEHNNNKPDEEDEDEEEWKDSAE